MKIQYRHRVRKPAAMSTSRPKRRMGFRHRLWLTAADADPTNSFNALDHCQCGARRRSSAGAAIASMNGN